MGDLAAVIMAAGLGTRMKSATPKHLHPLLGRRLVDWVVEAVRPLGADPFVVVVAPESAGAFGGLDIAVQQQPLGTGDSLRAARSKVESAATLLVVSGDHPRLTPKLLRRLVEEHRSRRLACQHRLEPPGVHPVQQPVIEHSGGVHHRAQLRPAGPDPRYQAGYLRPDCDVAGDHFHSRAGPGQFRRSRRRPGRGRA